MNEVMLEIQQVGEHLPMHGTSTVICPQCAKDYADQGRPHHWKPERSMSVTSTPQGILYYCFRASCPANIGGILRKGKIFPHEELPVAKPKEQLKQDALNPFMGKLTTIPRNIYEYYIEKYELPRSATYQQRWRYAPELEALAMPLYGADGTQWGMQMKFLKGPMKNKTYRTKPGYHLSFPRAPSGESWVPDHKRALFCVEDIISATKFVYAGVQACTLLGSKFSNEQAKELLNARFTRIVLMLDGDTRDKAVKFRKQWAPFFTAIHVVILKPEVDPKDWSFEQLQRADLIHQQKLQMDAASADS